MVTNKITTTAVSAHLAVQLPAKAISLHMGLNAVNGPSYGGWAGPLAACEFDANDMAAIAKSKGMKSTTLLTKQATRANAFTAMRAAAKSLKSGDLFFMTYSGHGGQVPDSSNDEPDKKDETWCLYDGQVIDDELYLELSRFAKGVRILVLSDSCHSGTVLREIPTELSTPFRPDQRPKNMPDAVAQRTYTENKAFYDKIKKDVTKALTALAAATTNPDVALAHVSVNNTVAAVVDQFNPSVILISGCQDNQTSMDGAHNGAFTEQVLKVWNHGLFTGNYPSFHARVRAGLPATQSPNLFTLGAAGAFLAERPFNV